MNSWDDFRWRKRLGWIRPNEGNDVAPIKRLKGLDEFKTPAFVGRMERVERRRKWQWYAMLVGAAVVGAGIGLVIL